MFVVTVDFLIRQGNEEAFAAEMKRNAERSLKDESGCLQFDVCRDPNEARKIFLYEVYTDKAAFELHLKSPHFLEFDRKVKDWTEGKIAAQWERIVPA